MNFIDVQVQTGRNDCGLFAIAFAVALCSGRDSHMMKYEQNETRIISNSASVQDK